MSMGTCYPQYAAHPHPHSCFPPSLSLVGGDLSLVNMSGYGVDAFLSLQRLDQDWQEVPSDSGVEPLFSTATAPEAAAAGAAH
jgi:hypothetical protein